MRKDWLLFIQNMVFFRTIFLIKKFSKQDILFNDILVSHKLNLVSQYSFLTHLIKLAVKYSWSCNIKSIYITTDVFSSIFYFSRTWWSNNNNKFTLNVVVVVVVEFAVTGRASECGVKHTKTADVIDCCSSSNQCLL